jgi:hypothetical protein
MYKNCDVEFQQSNNESNVMKYAYEIMSWTAIDQAWSC